MKSNTKNHKNEDIIYLSIDHLKKGKYQLQVLLENKIVKSIKINK